jgi:dihydrofolate synthase / folylpolyglutamate synthase
MIKSYPEAVAYLYANLPMFQRVGAAALKNDLCNTIELCEVLDNPQHKFRSVHVAGTNGKGSTSHMLASVLQSSGYRTGLYTSPHLKHFTERIKVNGQEIAESFVVDFVNRIRPAIEEIKPSFFEITVAMAFDYFVQQKIDIAVIEVGLGGRLDSTNVITPLVSVITNIGWDHKDILGDTLEKIASEKAGIIKKEIPVVVSERQPALEHVFINKSHELKSPIYFADDQYKVDRSDKFGFSISHNDKIYIENINLPLQGNYQKRNVAGVLKAIDVLKERNFSISERNIVQGLENVVNQTGLKGRWQILKTRPFMVCDTGHNEDGVKYVISQILEQTFKRLHMVWGMVKDKDITGILKLLPKDATYYFCQAKIPRAMDAGLLAEQASEYGLKGELFNDVNEAKNAALTNASDDDLIFIGGSTFVVAEIHEL